MQFSFYILKYDTEEVRHLLPMHATMQNVFHILHILHRNTFILYLTTRVWPIPMPVQKQTNCMRRLRPVRLPAGDRSRDFQAHTAGHPRARSSHCMAHQPTRGPAARARALRRPSFLAAAVIRLAPPAVGGLYGRPAAAAACLGGRPRQ